MECLSTLCCLSHTVCHAGMPLTDHWNTPQSFEQNAQREEKPFFLHQKITLHTSRTRIKLSEDEVPVAGVGRQTDDVFVGMVLGYLCGPSPALI